MFRLPSSQMLDLPAAGNTRRGDVDILGGSLYCGHQSAVADLRREIIMFFFKTERTRHAAATGVDFTDVVSGGFEHCDGRRGTDESFLMAVAVQQNLLAVAG